MMVIWAEGLGPEANPTQELYQALISINLNRVAGKIIKNYSFASIYYIQFKDW